MSAPGAIDLDNKSNWQNLGEIAKFAIGSKEVSGDPCAEFEGGAGRIGMIGGHVVKFNTHLSERLSGPKANQDMRDSCNELRVNLYKIAGRLDLDEATLSSIRSKLGLNLDGTAPDNAKLLDRKVVVSVINLIGKDSQIQKKGIDVWGKMNLRVQEIKDLASTKVDESGKTVKLDTHFQHIASPMGDMSGKTAKLDTHFGKITSNVDGGMSAKTAKLDTHFEKITSKVSGGKSGKTGKLVTHFASLPRPDENVIAADDEPLDVGQSVEEQAVKESEVEVLPHERDVEDIQPEVKPEVKPEVEEKISDDMNEVLNVFNSFDEKIFGNNKNGIKNWFEWKMSDFMWLSNGLGFKPKPDQADQIIKKQIADGTKFGQALKKQREDSRGFELKTSDPVSQSLATAINKYLAYGDVTETLGDGKETTAVKVCKILLEHSDTSDVPMGVGIRLSVAMAFINSNHELGTGEADKIVKYLFDAMTDLGLDLEKVKDGDTTVKQDFVNTIKKFYNESAGSKKCLWDAILRSVDIDPKQMGSGNDGTGEVGKKGDVN